MINRNFNSGKLGSASAGFTAKIVTTTQNSFAENIYLVKQLDAAYNLLSSSSMIHYSRSVQCSACNAWIHYTRQF